MVCEVATLKDWPSSLNLPTGAHVISVDRFNSFDISGPHGGRRQIAAA